jgi:hypothetical protein
MALISASFYLSNLRSSSSAFSSAGSALFKSASASAVIALISALSFST